MPCKSSSRAGQLAQPCHHERASTAFFEPAAGTSQAKAASGLEHRQAPDAGNQRLDALFLNAWNEWTEGSYLLPEEKYGTDYLETIKQVFGRQILSCAAA